VEGSAGMGMVVIAGLADFPPSLADLSLGWLISFLLWLIYR